MSEAITFSQAGLGTDAAVDAARPEILRRLTKVEADRNLRVLFACESGSRAWGFASDDSDFDVRFIFAHRPSDYLKLKPPKDAFDVMDGDFDLGGWDIRKTAELLRKSNAPLLEWLDSPIVYRADADIAAGLRQLRDDYFDPKKTVYHYLSLAGGVWKKYVKGNPEPVRKKYLYVLRPLACVRYIETHGRQPPTEFDRVLDGISLDAETSAAIDKLVSEKKANVELHAGPADKTLNTWIERTFADGEALAERLEPSDRDNAALDRFIAGTILC